MQTTIEVLGAEFEIEHTYHKPEPDVNYGGFFTIDRIFYKGVDIEPVLRKEKKTDFNYDDGTLFYGALDISDLWDVMEKTSPFTYIEDELNSIMDDANY